MWRATEPNGLAEEYPQLDSCLTFLVPLMGVVALRLDHAPSVLTAAAYLPVAALKVMTQWLITVKLSEAPGTLEEFMLAALCFALAGIFGLPREVLLSPLRLELVGDAPGFLHRELAALVYAVHLKVLFVTCHP